MLTEFACDYYNPLQLHPSSLYNCSSEGKICSNGACISSSSAVCGNAQVESGEQCDIGASNGACPALCSSACGINQCGVATGFVFQGSGDDQIIIKDFALKNSVEEIDLVYGISDHFIGFGRDADRQLRVGSNSITFDANTDEYFIASDLSSSPKNSYLMRALFKTENGVNMVDLLYKLPDFWSTVCMDKVVGSSCYLGNLVLRIDSINHPAGTDTKQVVISSNSDRTFNTLFDSNGNYIDLSKINLPASEIILPVMDSNGLVIQSYKFYWSLGEPKVQKLTDSPPSTTCAGCTVNGACVPIGYRLLVSDVPSYCDISGIKEQRVNTENITQSCQNNYECESNTCSSGKCVELEGFKAVLYKIFCKISNFIDSDAEARCVAQYVYGANVTNPVCGNAQVESGEQCDGSNLNGQSCTGLGFNSGTLSCNANCEFNSSSCSGFIPPLDLCAAVTCPTGQSCNPANGACVVSPPINSCTGVTCPSGQVCNANTGQCELFNLLNVVIEGSSIRVVGSGTLSVGMNVAGPNGYSANVVTANGASGTVTPASSGSVNAFASSAQVEFIYNYYGNCVGDENNSLEFLSNTVCETATRISQCRLVDETVSYTPADPVYGTPARVSTVYILRWELVQECADLLECAMVGNEPQCVCPTTIDGNTVCYPNLIHARCTSDVLYKLCEPHPRNALCGTWSNPASVCPQDTFCTDTATGDINCDPDTTGCESSRAQCEIGNTEVCSISVGQLGVKTCDNNCRWGECIPTSGCESNSPQCRPPQEGACTTWDGKPGTRTCNSDCRWNDICTASDCSSLNPECSVSQTDSCISSNGEPGTKTCGQDCMWGDCVCTPRTCVPPIPGNPTDCGQPDTCGNNGYCDGFCPGDKQCSLVGDIYRCVPNDGSDSGDGSGENSGFVLWNPTTWFG
jgi:hypothetical protein